MKKKIFKQKHSRSIKCKEYENIKINFIKISTVLLMILTIHFKRKFIEFIPIDYIYSYGFFLIYRV